MENPQCRKEIFKKRRKMESSNTRRKKYCLAWLITLLVEITLQ
jgi:hypothetical protein